MTKWIRWTPLRSLALAFSPFEEEKTLAEELLLQVADVVADLGVHFHAAFDEAAGVEHGAVVASTEGFADGVEGTVGEIARKKHGDLARKGDVLGPAFAGHVGDANVVVFGDFLLDDFDGDVLAAFFGEGFAEQIVH